MHFTLRQLEVFEAVARLGSYTKAARELHLSQPAVSMQVAQLEEQAGIALLEQVGRQARLTEAGRELYARVRAVQRELAEAEEVLAAHRGLRGGRLRLAVATTAGAFATRVLAAFARRHPGVRLALEIINRAELLARLEAHEADLAIMGQPPAGAPLRARPFLDNPLVVIASPEHPLAGQRRIPLARLAEERFVLREEGSGTRGALERLFAGHGLVLRAELEMSTNEAIKQSVAAGLGLAVVSLHTLELELAAGRVRILDVEGFPLMRRWYLVQRRGRRLGPAAAAFAAFLPEVAAEMVRLPDGVAPTGREAV
ncbi:LysR family transcriptional regulator [Inmirania thermothiophila]|uniref:DNA-binding transcriptional LysR family regulator n=1 Tax=Inmirania thermothiophila TaxID=1750597 RepID=A0A3N1XS34_9GAMM|nr:LysR family transcriptional regulator [Inmirania thermothiophila]ROR29473.1 DNA-binding transcriptional LysR family regulator [Inmirania thermothiophila]